MFNFHQLVPYTVTVTLPVHRGFVQTAWQNGDGQRLERSHAARDFGALQGRPASHP